MHPKRQLCFWGHVQLEHRKTWGCSASSSEQEGSTSDHTRAEHLGEEWWKSSLRRGATMKPRKSRRGCSITKECRATAHNWLIRPPITNPQSGLVVDFSNWTVLKWWERYGPGHPDIAGLGEASAVCASVKCTSQRAFSKAGLIISKKRQRLTLYHVDSISLLGWHYKDKGWGESAKRPRCAA